MKKIFKFSKWIHKWSSLLICIILIWMSISGILLNHPEIISNISVPSSFLPEDYNLVNWNRSAIVEAEFATNKTAYFGGHEGIFKTDDGGYSFTNLNKNGFPNAAYNRKTKSIALFSDNSEDVLFAGTFSGLYKFNSKTDYWKKVNFPSESNKIVSLIKKEDSLIVVTDSEMFISKVINSPINFRKIKLERIDDNPSMTLIELFFQLHSGELWGLSGKIIFDIAALILVFLCISGLYLWISPKYRKLKKKLNLTKGKIHTGWFFRNHLLIGIWSFAILLVFAVTGLFMRPPLIIALLGKDVAVKYIPVNEDDNPWKHRIRNAFYDHSTNKTIIDSRDGFWVSTHGLDGQYIETDPPVPIFAMGATVLKNDDDGNLLVGSFAGLYKISNSGLYAENILDKSSPIISSVRPGANLITGYFKDFYGEEYVTTHFGGLINVKTPEVITKKYQMPEFLKANYKMPLWNFLFELHNGRLFQSLLGDFYILFIPLLSLIFIVVILTGVFDWFYRRFR